MLSTEEQWKTVMAAVPRSFDDSEEFQHKYSTDQVNIIENYSRQTGKLGMDVLLDEWGTSGRVRPTVADLYLLCSSLELFRAADFLLEQLMGGEKPSRTFSLAVNGAGQSEVLDYIPPFGPTPNFAAPSPSVAHGRVAEDAPQRQLIAPRIITILRGAQVCVVAAAHGGPPIA